jgi:hypothetical protein
MILRVFIGILLIMTLFETAELNSPQMYQRSNWTEGINKGVKKEFYFTPPILTLPRIEVSLCTYLYLSRNIFRVMC